MGPDRTQFAKNLALTITQLVERQIGPPPSPSSPGLPPAQPFLNTPTTYSLPRGRVPVTPKSPRATSQEITFDAILNEPKLAQAFHSLLAKSHCSENLEFYDTVDEFRYVWPRDAASLADSDQRKAMADSARHIWSLYIEPGAAMQVNIDSEVVAAIERQLETPRTTMFDEAQSAVRLLMMDNWFGRFVSSKEFKLTQELLQVQEDINAEHARIREWLGKVAQSERMLPDLEERKRDLESRLAATLGGSRGSPLSSMTTPTTFPTIRRNMQPPTSLVICPAPTLVICPAPPLVSEWADASSSSSSSSSSQATAPSPSSSSLSSSSTSSSSSSSETTLRHIKQTWSAVMPHIPRRRSGSKSYEQLMTIKKGAKRFWQKESSGNDWLLAITVIQAKDIVSRTQDLTAYVVVKLGRQKYQTSVAALSDTNPRWREYFTFNVGKDDEGHKISVKLRHGSGATSETLGGLKLGSPRSFSSSADRWYPLESRQDGSAVIGELRLLIHYRPQKTKERELYSTLKYLNKSIEEEEKESAREEQRHKRRHGNLIGAQLSQDDAYAVPGLPVTPATKAKWRHSALVILPPTLGGENHASNELLRQLNQKKDQLEKELLQFDLDRAAGQQEEEEEARSPLGRATKSESDCASLGASRTEESRVSPRGGLVSPFSADDTATRKRGATTLAVPPEGS